jgi:hypothetical protein
MIKDQKEGNTKEKQGENGKSEWPGDWDEFFDLGKVEHCNEGTDSQDRERG